METLEILEQARKALCAYQELLATAYVFCGDGNLARRIRARGKRMAGEREALDALTVAMREVLATRGATVLSCS